LDFAVEKGLADAGCQIRITKSITDTLVALREQQSTLEAVLRARAQHIASPSRFMASNITILVASVQAGALTMLEVLGVEDIALPLTLLVDMTGDDVQMPLKAMKMGVRDYLLPTDSDAERAWRSRKLIEDARKDAAAHAQRMISSSRNAGRRLAIHTHQPPSMRWDIATQTIFIGDRDRMRLSPVEARTFDLLFTHRGSAVPLAELIACTLTAEEAHDVAYDAARDEEQQIQLLRTHLARLRRRLESNPNFAYRIENVRGSGYVML